MRALVGSLSIVLMASPAFTAEPGKTLPPSVASFVACREVAQAADRLACFDSAAERFDRAAATGEVVILNRAEAHDLGRRAFGLSAVDDARLAGKDGSAAALKSVDAVVRSVELIDYDHFRFVLEDGAIWQTTEEARAGVNPRPGVVAHLDRGVAGGYFVSFGTGARIRARRIG